MASSDFWRERAAEFQLVPDHGMLRADGHYTVGSGAAWTWQLAGGANEFIRTTFESLARRAAFELADAPTTDLLVAWLEAIRKEHINFQSPQIATEVREDGSEGPQYVLGTIDQVCNASVILCRKLESDALQAEFEDKRRNDPKSWSQFRQQYEAFRSMKDVINEPAERIPEEWGRSTIARIQGIKPEDVTLKQIAFEVSGLLSSTKRHIELIPSAPQGSPASETKPEVQTDTAQAPSESRVDPKVLRDSYLANFPDERIKIRDLCWAAGQHYREWKRWLAGELKDGSTPDRAFRRVLTSGKRPLELNKKHRPKGWE
jgi:hypothetical protein